MKVLSEAGLMAKLLEAYSRGVSDAFKYPEGPPAEPDPLSRLIDLVHEDAGGHDGLGVKHG